MNNSGCNTAIWGATEGSLALCQWLLGRGADFTHVNHFGHGPVVKAAWRGNTPLLRWLLGLGGVVDQVFMTDADGKLPVELAELRGHTDAAQYLRDVMQQHPQAVRPAPAIALQRREEPDCSVRP